MTDDARSAETCPRCGAHRVALLDFPDVPTVGYQVAAESLGFTEAGPQASLAIGCLACGAEWPDLDAFRAESATSGTRPPEPSHGAK